jgi:hypothetical protein
VNPFDEYPFTAVMVAERLPIGRNKVWALINHLDLKSDEASFRELPVGGGATLPRYSQRAVERLRAAIDELGRDAVDEIYRRRRRRLG